MYIIMYACKCTVTATCLLLITILHNGVAVVGYRCGHHYCLNNGVCVRGERESCNCQPGFTGRFCEQEICEAVLL